MKLKICCKYIGEENFKIIVNNETQNIYKGNNVALFENLKADTYIVKIIQELPKKKYRLILMLLFLLTFIFRGLINILLMNTDYRWYKHINPYYLKCKFKVDLRQNANINFIYCKGSFNYKDKSIKNPKICVDLYENIETEYYINKHNLKQKYWNYICNIISIGIINEILFAVLFFVALNQSLIPAAIICVTTLCVIVIVQLIISLIEYNRLVHIISELEENIINCTSIKGS